MSEMAPREMHRAWMTAFGNAKLAHRARVGSIDLPDAHQRRTPMGFVH
jgi:ATP-dependent Lon protease